MSTVRLTWVVDDDAAPPLRAEHGYAMWVETAAGQVLFDTGGSGEVLRHNLGRLGLEPQSLDAVVLSHGHDDHTGGLAALVEDLRPETPVHAHPTLFRERYSRRSGATESRGIPVARAALEPHLKFALRREPTEVSPGVWTTGEVAPRPEPEGRSRWHFIAQDGHFVPDPYEDDLSLVIEVGPEQIMLICGCCHAGLINTLVTVRRRWAGRVVAIAGGVHLANAPTDVVDHTLEVLAGLDGLACLWLGHCSGAAICEAASARLQGVAVWTSTAGRSLTIEDGTVSCG